MCASDSTTYSTMSHESNTLYEPYSVNGIYPSKTGFNYTYLFAYEKKYFNEAYLDINKSFMTTNWNMSVRYALVYLVVIFSAHKYMKTREKFDLRLPLIAWNLVLAGFSILGTVRVWPEFIHVFQTHGFKHTYCSNDWSYGVTGCWFSLFILSKVPELLDTVFIVARKQKLIFLHWYHHCTVLIYSWFSSIDYAAPGRWFVVMNFTVHACMYSYYTLRALRVSIPKWVNIAITSAQLVQMIVGVYINYLAYSAKQKGETCAVSDSNIAWSFWMYFSYFILFFNFFYSAYVAPLRSHHNRDSFSSGKIRSKKEF